MWLTLYLGADLKLEPDDDESTEPHLELNLWWEENPDSVLKAGTSLVAPSYCEVRGNLTNMYYLTHLGFEHAMSHIVATGDQTLKAYAPAILP